MTCGYITLCFTVWCYALNLDSLPLQRWTPAGRVLNTGADGAKKGFLFLLFIVFSFTSPGGLIIDEKWGSDSVGSSQKRDAFGFLKSFSFSTSLISQIRTVQLNDATYLSLKLYYLTQLFSQFYAPRAIMSVLYVFMWWWTMNWAAFFNCTITSYMKLLQPHFRNTELPL